MIEPYEKTLNKMPIAERRGWAKLVTKQMDLAQVHGDEAIVLAGLNYRRHLEMPLLDRFREVVVPMPGFAFGEQLSWLKEHTDAVVVFGGRDFDKRWLYQVLDGQRRSTDHLHHRGRNVGPTCSLARGPRIVCYKSIPTRLTGTTSAARAGSRNAAATLMRGRSVPERAPLRGAGGVCHRLPGGRHTGYDDQVLGVRTRAFVCRRPIWNIGWQPMPGS